MMLRSAAVVLWMAASLSPAWARAADPELEERIRELERQIESLSREKATEREQHLIDQIYRLEARIDQLESTPVELEAGRSTTPAPAGAWYERLRISGNADLNWLDGERNSKAQPSRFALENARLFFDFDLSEEVGLGSHALFEQTSFYLEWDLFRKDLFQNEIAQLYFRGDSLLGWDWLNLRVGRVPIPFGEEYLRFHERRPDNPLISFTVASPYGVDEGVMLFGSLPNVPVHYAVALTDGDEGFNLNTDSNPQIAGRLAVDPLPWLRLSISGLNTGGVGPTPDRDYGLTAMMIGSFGAYPITLATFKNGTLVPADPASRLDGMTAWEADVRLHWPRYGRLWFAYGKADMESASSVFYDRRLTYWSAEGVLELGWMIEPLRAVYLAGRFSTMGTGSRDEGWRFRVMNNGEDLLYNVARVDRWSAGFGVRLHDNATLKGEYTFSDFDMVRGTPIAFQRLARDKDYWGLGLSLDF